MSTEYQRLIGGLVHWDEDVRKLCAERLEAFDYPVAELLVKALSDSNASIRSIAAESLGMRRDACAKEPLSAALMDADHRVVASAAVALANIGERDVVAVDILRNPNMTVAARAAAINGIASHHSHFHWGSLHAKHKITDAQRFCQEMSGDDDPVVRQLATELLHYLENELVLPGSRDKSTDSSQLLRSASGVVNVVGCDELLHEAE